jgi:hypothetical protein
MKRRSRIPQLRYPETPLPEKRRTLRYYYTVNVPSKREKPHQPENAYVLRSYAAFTLSVEYSESEIKRDRSTAFAMNCDTSEVKGEAVRPNSARNAKRP